MREWGLSFLSNQMPATDNSAGRPLPADGASEASGGAVIRCAGCGQKINVPQRHLADPGRCPRCQTAFEPVRPARKTPRPLSRWQRSIALSSWIYLALLVCAAAIMHGLSESWTINSLLLFGPRWLLFTPLPFLAVVAAVWRPAALLPLATGAVAFLFFIAGWVGIWPRHDGGPRGGTLRVVTCNAGGQQLDVARFERYLQQTQPDVVVLQESGESLCQALFGAAGQSGWTIASSGGEYVASRLPIEARAGLASGGFELSGAVGAFDVTMPGGHVVRLIDVHLPTARDGISAVMYLRLNGLGSLLANSQARDRASATARAVFTRAAPSLVVAGDFNSPPESSVLRRHWGDLGNAFRSAGFGFGHTKFTSWHGVRIDHILYGPTWGCRYCAVGPDVGSDHRPVLAVLEPRALSPSRSTP